MLNVNKKSAFLLLATIASNGIRAEGPYALVSGRWDPVVIVIDIGAALEPANDGTPNAIISRTLTTLDVDTDGDQEPDTAAGGLPSNVVIAHETNTVFVVNHAGDATPAEVAAFPHGHSGTVSVLDLQAVLDPENDGSQNAIETVIPTGGHGPVGLSLLDNEEFFAVGSSEGPGNEDGGRIISIIDLAREETAAVIQMPISDGGTVAQAPGRSCAELLSDPALVPRAFPDGNVGCFSDINSLGFSDRYGRYVLAANGGTDDVSIIDLELAIAGGVAAEVARIPVERGPWGLAVSPSGELAAVTNRESAETGDEGNSVSILNIGNAIDGNPDAEVARVIVGTDNATAGARPFGIAFTPNGREIVVANNRSNTVSIIDVEEALEGSAEAEVDRLPLVRPDGAPARPRGIAVTPDGRFALISGGARDAAGGGSLWIVDLNRRETIATVTGVGNEPYLLDITREAVFR